jgi:hypothetical protein
MDGNGAYSMSERADSIKNLSVGDIFHAESPNGASLICLVTSVTIASLHARTVTTQKDYEFDRRTGVALSGPERCPCIVDSVKPMPPEVPQTFLELDRRYRLGGDPERFKLLEAEKRALIFVASYYPENPV